MIPSLTARLELRLPADLLQRFKALCYASTRSDPPCTLSFALRTLIRQALSRGCIRLPSQPSQPPDTPTPHRRARG